MAFKMKKFSGFKELVGNQSKIDMNKDGKLSKVDFEMLGNESPNKIITTPTPTGPPTFTGEKTGIDPSGPGSTGSTSSSSSSTISNVKPQTLDGASGNTANRPTPGSLGSISPVKPQTASLGPQHSANKPTPPGSGNKPDVDAGNTYVARKKGENPYGGVDSAFNKMKQVGDDKLSAMNQDERKKDQAKQSSALKMMGIRKKK